MNAPIPMEWTGEVMRPQQRYVWQARKQFEIGAAYPLVIHEERSTNSHNHFFAAVHEAWKNLPEHLSKKHPTSEHLRKWALIKGGFADERSIACDSNAEALKVAAFIKPMDEYSVVVVRDDVVKVFTAQSQSARTMDKKAFQDSKTAVLEIVSEMIGVDPVTLSKNTNPSQTSSPETIEPAPTKPPVSGAGSLIQSTLPDGWRTTYLDFISKPADSPKSLLTLHTEALAAIIGTPTDEDLAEMRALYGLRQRNLTGGLSKADYDAAVRELV